jgi:hypothetical protein
MVGLKGMPASFFSRYGPNVVFDELGSSFCGGVVLCGCQAYRGHQGWL